jgi:hypothetical protein
MGGKEKFSERLDSLFNEQYNESKYWFLAQFPDSTGLIGQYPLGMYFLLWDFIQYVRANRFMT